MQADADLLSSASKGVGEFAGVWDHILGGLLQALLGILECLLNSQILLVAAGGNACQSRRRLSRNAQTCASLQ